MILLVLGTVMGLVMGLTGLGGATLVLPLMMALGWSLAEAVPVVLAGSCVAALCSVTLLWPYVYVRYRLAALIAAASIPFVAIGHWLILRLPATQTETAFCLLVVALALYSLWRAPARTAARRRPLLAVNPRTGRLSWTVPSVIAASTIGGVSGLTAGLFGLGGGFVIAPTLRALSELDAHTVLATTLMAVGLISGAAVLSITLSTGWTRGVDVLPFALGAVSGTCIGAHAATTVSAATINTLLSLLMLGLALAMLARLVEGG